MNALLVGATTAAAAHRPVAVAVAVALVVQHGSNEYHVLQTKLAKFGERISMANLSICVAPGEDTESRSSKECVIKIFTLLPHHHQTSPGVTLSHVACGGGGGHLANSCYFDYISANKFIRKVGRVTTCDLLGGIHIHIPNAIIVG